MNDDNIRQAAQEVTLPKSYDMNMCSDQHAGPVTRDCSCLNTTRPGTRDPRTSTFQRFVAATSETMKPW